LLRTTEAEIHFRAIMPTLQRAAEPGQRLTVRDFERMLRHAGLSRSRARMLAGVGKYADFLSEQTMDALNATGFRIIPAEGRGVSNL
jgi:hypothetical protein